MHAIPCLLLAVSLACAAAPPATLTPEQEELRRQCVFLWNEGVKAWQAGKREEAVHLMQKALYEETLRVGSWHRNVVLLADHLGYCHQACNDWAKEADCRRVVFEARRVLDGDGHYRTVNARLSLAEALAQQKRTPAQREALERSKKRNEQAIALHRSGQTARALPLAMQALAIRRDVLGEKHPHYAQSLHNLAGLHQSMGDHRAALPLYQQALAITRDALGEKHPGYADSLNNLAVLHHSMGDHQAALTLYQQALAIRRDVLGKKHPQYAQSLDNLAGLHQSMGDHRVALPLYQQALAIIREALGEKHPHYAQSLHNLAGLHKSMGDYWTALPLYQKALAITKHALGEKHPDYAQSLNNLAALHRSMGDHRTALQLNQKALAITKQALGEKHPDYAQSLNNLAALHKSIGDHRAALTLHQQALAIRREVLGEKHPHYAQSLNNLAVLLESMGDHRAALTLYEQALDIRKQALGEKHPAYADSLNNLAGLHQSMGGHRAALMLSQQALAIRREALGEKHPEYADSLNNLAGLHQSMGDHRAALVLTQKALAIRREALGEKHPAYVTGLNNLAVLHQDMNRLGAALVLSEQAMYLTRRQLALDASVQSERQQRDAADVLRHRLDLRLSLPDESAQLSHKHVLGWKGSTFAAQLARRRFLLATADPATQKLAVELRDITGSLALLRDRQDETSRQRAVELAQQKEALEVQLALLSADFRLALKPPTSEQLRAGLPAGTVLLDFLVYTGFDPVKPIKGQESQRRLVVWVVRPDAATVRLDLGLMGPIERHIQAWRDAIDRGDDATEVAARLRQRLWEPLEKHLAGAKLVLISPDEALGRLPFAALPGREEGKYLLEEIPLALLPVPQVLERVLERPTSKPSLLTLGGVDYGDGKVWSALPGTAAEMKAVEARFRALFKGETTTLSGTRASKPAVRDALPRHRFAHLATHGYFAPASMRSFLDCDDRGPRDLLGREGVTGWDPALLSGLVFAGANRPPRPGEDDGLLTASEVAEMNLSGVELAVLSACQTGRGKEAGGEGILGLQRAFAVSGCKTTVTSLWSVDDAATSVLMERFYHHLWEKKLPKLEALRQAQLEVMRHPEWVEARRREMAALAGLRGAGKVAEALVGGKRERRSPAAWWAAWQLSGDWR